MKKKYLNIEMEFILLEGCDIITTSDGIDSSAGEAPTNETENDLDDN